MTPNISRYSNKQVIDLLVAQATAGQDVTVLTPDDVESLFMTAYQQYAGSAGNGTKLGPGTVSPTVARNWPATFAALTAREEITPIDQYYNNGYVFRGMAAALEAGDLIRAGFEVVDSQNVYDGVTTSAKAGLKLRMEAEFQNLVAGDLAGLGQIVPKP